MATVFPSSMPYDDIEIIDKSSYTEETVTEAPYIPSGPIAFIPFISPKGYGEDNKLMYMNGSQLNMYGDPNLKKYGLSLYLAKRFVEGGGTVLGMRVANSFKTAFTAVAAQIITKEVIPSEKDNAEVYHPIFNIDENTTVTFDEITMPAVDSAISDITIKYTVNDVTKTDKLNSLVLDDDTKFKLTPIKNSVKQAAVEITYNSDPIVTKVDASMNFELIYNGTSSLVLASQKSVPTIKYLKYTGKGVDAGAKLADIIAEAAKVNNYGVDDTTNVYPLFVVASRSAGKFANAFRFRITVDEAQNSYIDMSGDDAFCYKFIDSNNGNKLDEPFTFSFNDDYLYNKNSMAVDDAFETYSKNIVMSKLAKFDDFMEKLESMICTEDGEVGKFSDGINKVDFLFGTNVSSDLCAFDLSTINLTNSLGISLENGNDPVSIDSDNNKEKAVTFTWKNDPFASDLAAAYNGELSDLIFDQVRYPFQYVFCPSMDTTVINAVHTLVTDNRKMTRAVYFVADEDSNNLTSMPATYEKARDIVASKLSGCHSWKENFTSEWARITDPYMGRKVYMPSVYFDAYTYPDHWIKRKGRPLAGRTNAVWSGFDVGTVTPASSNTNEYVLNHNAGMNTMCEDGLGNAVLYEQITSQKETSRLSEINNAQVLCEMVRIALKVANDSRWSDLPDDEINTYKTKVETAISDELSGCYQDLSIVATRESVNGAGRNRILCAINVVFKDMLKGVTYKFYILAQ